MRDPKISIIIPVYKTEQYLEKCMASVLNGTLYDIEVILIDDASPDGMECDKYADKDNRVRVVHLQQNKGLSAVRNEGVRQARAPYIGFVDSDDWIHPNMYEELYNLATKHGAQIVSCGMIEYEIDSQEDFRNAGSSKNAEISIMYNMEALGRILTLDSKAPHTAWGKLYDRQLFEGVEYPEVRVYEDASTTYKLYYKANKVVHTDARYYFYAIRRTGIANAGFKPKSMDKLVAANEIIGFVNKNCPELYQHARCFEIVSALRLAADFIPSVIKDYPNEYEKVDAILRNPQNGRNQVLSLRHKILLLLYKYCRPAFFAVWRRRLSV